MKLKYIILYVDNVAETLAFYQRAFGLERKMLHESGDYGELDTGRTLLSFSALKLMHQLGKPAAAPDTATASFEIALETADVDQALKKALAAGAKLVQPAAAMPWGQTTAYVRDINGFLVEICSPVQR